MNISFLTTEQIEAFQYCRTLHYTEGNFTDTPRYGRITHFWSK